ncbi:MAG: hypothetical protein HY453_02430 [Parcubacteria group bacterium]|nr:hypothetical protein [Parcubacteria group bacterium]
MPRTSLSSAEIQDRIAKIQNIYREFLKEMDHLKQEQKRIIQEALSNMEAEELRKIKSKLQSS